MVWGTRWRESSARTRTPSVERTIFTYPPIVERDATKECCASKPAIFSAQTFGGIPWDFASAKTLSIISPCSFFGGRPLVMSDISTESEERSESTSFCIFLRKIIWEMAYFSSVMRMQIEYKTQKLYRLCIQRIKKYFFDFFFKKSFVDKENNLYFLYITYYMYLSTGELCIFSHNLLRYMCREQIHKYFPENKLTFVLLCETGYHTPYDTTLYTNIIPI